MIRARDSRCAGRIESGALYWRRRHSRQLVVSPSFEARVLIERHQSFQGAGDAMRLQCMRSTAQDLDAAKYSEPEARRIRWRHSKQIEAAVKKEQGHDLHEGTQLPQMRILVRPSDLRPVGEPLRDADVLADPECEKDIKRYSNGRRFRRFISTASCRRMRHHPRTARARRARASW